MPKRFQKEIIRPGSYKLPDGRSVDVTPERIHHWATTHQKMVQGGLLVPAPYHHDEAALPVRDRAAFSDADASRNGGFWDRLWVDDETGSLMGELEAATDADAEAIGAKVKGVSLLARPWHEGGVDWTDAITHVALTNKPVAHGTSEFVALSLDGFAADTGDMNNTDPNTDGQMPKRTGGSSLESCLAVLASYGLALPDDTTEETLVERICAAGTAVSSYKQMQEGDSVTTPPKGSQTQPPSPVAMSQELELAVSLLNGAKVTDPTTSQPFTVESLKQAAAKKATEARVALSAEDQALVAFARDQVRDAYGKRLEALVKTGRVTPKMAKDVGLPMLQNLHVAFSADGKPVENELDRVLKAWEAIPAGSVLTGNSPTGYARQTSYRDQPFSLDLSAPNVDVQELPEEAHQRDPNSPLSEDEADKIAEEQLKMAGIL